MRVTILNEVPEDPELSVAWNELVWRMEHPEVFFTYQWALAASRAFRESLHPLLFLMHDSDQLSGVAALAIDLNMPKRAVFLGASTADYCDVLSATENRGLTLDALLREMKKLGLRDLVLANLPSDSSTLMELPRVARSCGFHRASRAAYECPVVEFGNEQQRKDLVRAVAHKEREKRGLKRLGMAGSIQVTHANAPEQVEQNLKSIVHTQVLRFLATDRVSPLVHAERRTFLKEVGSLLAQAGWLKISRLEVNGEPIAWNYGFRFGDSWLWYLPTFQVQHEDSSPGSCLLRLLVEEGCADASLRRLDLGLGGESYKDRFGNALRRTCYVELSRSFAQCIANISRQALTSNIARFPRFEKKLRRARDLARALRTRIQETGIAAVSEHLFRRLTGYFKSQDEVLVFEAPEIGAHDPLASIQLSPLSWDNLAEAAIDHACDPSALRYLMRCAQRKKLGVASGFVLAEPARTPVHYLWVTSFDGFHLSELNHTLDCADPTAAVIFDCWTPVKSRGRSHYATAIRQAAANLQREGRKAWVFSAATNLSSVRGILKAGFEYRFSLVRFNRFGHPVVIRRDGTNSLP